MNYLDLIILGTIGFFLIKGLFRGFFREVLGLVGLIVALILATKYMSNVSVWIDSVIDVPPSAASLLAYLLIFFAVFIATQVLAHTLQRLFKYSMLGGLEKMAGGIVGFLKGATIISLLVLFISVIPFGRQFVPDTAGSVLFRPMQNFAPYVFNFLMTVIPNSKSFYDELKENFDNFSAGDLAENTSDFLNSFQKASPQDTPDSDDLSH
ncbi:CvpA family protein [bacterium]|nr:CvpA family protein [bacterium]